MDADVIVVGGGPGGASTAWHLARAGCQVLLLDRAYFPRDKPCAEYLSPEASRILSTMGALECCEAAGASHLAGMIVRAPNGTHIHGDFVASHGFRGFCDQGLALRRHLLDSILLDCAVRAGTRVEYGMRVTDVLHDSRGAARGVRAIDPSGGVHERTSRFVVGADGLRSVIARRLGLAHAAHWPRRIAFVTHYRGVAEIGPYGEMHVERDGYVGLARVGNETVNVALVIPVAYARTAAGDPSAFLNWWISSRPHLAQRFTHAVQISPVRTTGPFAQRARRAWAKGAALVGDAADFYDPFTGEGIYAALHGGELLTLALLEALSAPTPQKADAALASYDRARRKAFAGKWAVERLVSLGVAFPPLMNYAARSLSRHKDMADLLVGVTGDFVPPQEVLSVRYLTRLLLPVLSSNP